MACRNNDLRLGDGKPIEVLGEGEEANREARLQRGIPIDDNTWRQICAAVKQVGMPLAVWALRGGSDSDRLPLGSRFVRYFVGVTCPLDMCKAEFPQVHTGDKRFVRADDIQQL